MRITVTVDDSAAEQALTRYVAAMEQAALDASYEAANLIGRLTRAYLATLSHAAGTKTPSGAGMPPAWITGGLAASVRASMEGEWGVVGPTTAASSYNGPIGRALELGHFYRAHNPTGYMHWYEAGRGWVKSRTADHPDHPYLKPMTDLAVSSGMVEEIYRRHWAAAQAESI